MRQRFRLYEYVLLGREFLDYSVGTAGIIAGSYHQLHGGGDKRAYSVYILNKAQGTIVDTCSWFDETELHRHKKCRDKALALVERYLDRRH